jgi:hypothetical protein
VTAIFLSYRRINTSGYAGRLADSLEKHFGEGSVFQDIEAIAPGSNFVQAIDAAIARCQVLLVLIGDTWLTECGSDGSPRLSDPADFVRLEVAAGLRSGMPVIPVLVRGARMPAESALPDDLKPLVRLQAMELSDTRWDYDVERLANVMRASTGGRLLRRRNLLLAGAGIMLVAVAGTVGYFVYRQPLELSGQWMLPNGSFWVVLQDGRRLTIEETHYDSKQVWKRGAGTVDGRRVEFFFETIYGLPRRYEGTLTVASDTRSMSGVVRESNAERGAAVALTRAR